MKTAIEKGRPDWESESVLQKLKETLAGEGEEIFYYQKFDLLIKELEINGSKMAAALHYDPSYISKIPGREKGTVRIRLYFVESICSYLTKNCCSVEERRKIASLTGNTLKNWKSGKTVFRPIQNWLCFAEFEKNDYVSGFLLKKWMNLIWMIISEPFILTVSKSLKFHFSCLSRNIITDWRKCVKESWIF